MTSTLTESEYTVDVSIHNPDKTSLNQINCKFYFEMFTGWLVSSILNSRIFQSSETDPGYQVDRISDLRLWICLTSTELYSNSVLTSHRVYSLFLVSVYRHFFPKVNHKYSQEWQGSTVKYLACFQIWQSNSLKTKEELVKVHPTTTTHFSRNFGLFWSFI